MTMRILGLDMGDVRIGIAISDENQTIALPVQVYERKGPRQDVAFLKALFQERMVQDVIVGMPYKMSGGMSTMGQRISDFVDLLKESCANQIVFWDERMSSVQANRSMLEGDWSRRKRKSKVDVVAAQLILQAYLDSKRIAREREEENRRWGRG